MRRQPNLKTEFTDAQAEKYYLIYSNDFLTVAKFAAYYGISKYLANQIIKQGRAINHLTN